MTVVPEGSGSQSDQLESLIAQYLEAKKAGETLDRQELIEKHPELADSLRGFFAKHDKMSRAAMAEDTPTLPPDACTSNELAAADTPTLGTEGSHQPAFVRRKNTRHFGDYELMEEIARGGMGVVFKARQITLNRTVALKMILAGQFAGENDVQRFHTEAQAAARLDHPGIVPIFEIGAHEGQQYFSMGYVEGQSLAEKLASGPLAPRQAAHLLEKICVAMAYAHERGVIHRDLKPANILIDESGQPKVTDFGLAKRMEADSNLTGTGQVLGTPAYMPPEQASGKVEQVGHLVDVYALGAILYCMLTGRPPFQADNPMDTLMQVVHRDPIPPRQLVPTVPRDLDTICRKCLSKDPAKRYVTASELASDLQRFLNDEPIQARPAGRIERAAKWASKQPAVAAVLLSMPAWLLGEPKIGAGLLALIAGFHLPFRLRPVRLSVVFTLASMAALVIGGLGYLFITFGAESTGSPARVAAIGLLSATGPAGVLIFVFLFDCVSMLDQPLRRQMRWLLIGSALVSLLCIGGFLFYLSSHSEQISAIIEQLSGELVSLTTGTTPTTSEVTTNEVTTSDAMMQLIRSRMVLWIPSFTAIVWLYLVLGITIARLIRKLVFVADPSHRNGRKRSPPRLVKRVDGDVSRWAGIVGAVAIAVLPYALSRLLALYDIQLVQALALGNPTDSVVWIVVAAWLGAYAFVSRRNFLIAGVVSCCLGALLAHWTIDSLQENRQQVVLLSRAATPIATSESLVLELDGHQGPVKYVDIGPSGRVAVSGSGWPLGDGTLRLWHLQTGKMLWVRHHSPDLIMAARLISNGQRVVSGGRSGMVHLWETETARELGSFQACETLEGLWPVVFDGVEYCLLCGEEVQLWDLDSLTLVRQYDGVEQTQLDVTVSGDGRRVASGGFDNMVHVWDFDGGNRIDIGPLHAAVESVALNEDGSQLLIALNQPNDQPALMTVAVDKPETLAAIQGHEATVNWVRYSPNWKVFVTAARDRTVRVWDAGTNAPLKVLRGHQDWVWTAVFTPSGDQLLTAGGGSAIQDPGTDWTLKLWDMTSAE